MEHKEFFSEHGENKTMNVNTAFISYNHLLVHNRESQNIFKVQKVAKLKEVLCLNP